MLVSFQSLTVMSQPVTAGKPLAKPARPDTGRIEKDLTSWSRGLSDQGVLEPRLAGGALAGVGVSVAAAGGAMAGALVGGAIGALAGSLSSLGLGLQTAASGPRESSEMRKLKQFARSLNGGGGSAPIAEHDGYVIVGGSRVRRRAASFA